jgi:hypothetical protein
VISSNQQSHNTVPPTGDAGGVILVPGGDIDVGGRPRSAK